MSCSRKEIVNCAVIHIGRNETDGSHKKIIDIYNAQKKLPRGYKVKYTDPWCATFTSAVALECNAEDIVPIECGCDELITLAKNKGIWVESDSYTPEAGDLILYDWDDNGKGDCKGAVEHVGLVEYTSGNTIMVIEGNYSNSVKRRKLSVNGQYIRGYITPKYKAESSTVTVKQSKTTVVLSVLRKGCMGVEVSVLQTLLKAHKISVGSCGVDGDFGNDTQAAVEKYQKKYNLAVDGVVGHDTWTHLLSGK